MSVLGQTCLQHLVQFMRASVNTMSAHLVWHACTAPSTVHQLSSWPFGKAAKLHPWKAWYSPGRQGTHMEANAHPEKKWYNPWKEWYSPGSQGIRKAGYIHILVHPHRGLNQERSTSQPSPPAGQATKPSHDGAQIWILPCPMSQIWSTCSVFPTHPWRGDSRSRTQLPRFWPEPSLGSTSPPPRNTCTAFKPHLETTCACL